MLARQPSPLSAFLPRWHRGIVVVCPDNFLRLSASWRPLLPHSSLPHLHTGASISPALGEGLIWARLSGLEECGGPRYDKVWSARGRTHTAMISLALAAAVVIVLLTNAEIRRVVGAWREMLSAGGSGKTLFAC